jgi:hypothetical protein
MIVSVPEDTAVKSDGEAVPAVVLHDSTTSSAAAGVSVTGNAIASPSSADAAPTDTVADPELVIDVVAVVPLTPAVPVVDAPVSLTISVSPGSTRLSVRVAIVIVPEPAPEAIVSVPPGAV